MTTRVDRVVEYRNHLRSPEWQEIREISKDRTAGLCAHCGAIATQVHHVKYPKRFGDDSVSNTIPVCDRCHRLNHGALPMLSLKEVREMREITPLGGEFVYLVSEGVPWATLKEWVRALRFPSEARLGILIATCCRELAGEGESPQADFQGQTVYRWLTVSRALLLVHAAYQQHQFKGDKWRDLGITPEQWGDWMASFLRYYTWGAKLQEKVIAHLMQSHPQVGVKGDLAQAMALIAKVQAGQAVEIHELQEQFHKDPNEFITARQRLLERGIDDTVMPVKDDGRTWAGLLGTALSKSGCEKGPLSLVRFEASQIKREVNTWHRSDLDHHIDRIVAWLKK